MSACDARPLCIDIYVYNIWSCKRVFCWYARLLLMARCCTDDDDDDDDLVVAPQHYAHIWKRIEAKQGVGVLEFIWKLNTQT